MPASAIRYAWKGKMRTLTQILGDLDISPAAFHSYRSKAGLSTVSAIIDYELGLVIPKVKEKVILFTLGGEMMSLPQACGKLNVPMPAVYSMMERRKFESVQETLDYYYAKQISKRPSP